MNTAIPANYFAFPGITGQKSSLRELVDRLLYELEVPSIDVLQDKTRKREVVSKRQIIMYILRWHGGFTLTQIGTIFRKDHATVLHSERAVKNDMITDKDLCKQIESLKRTLRPISLRIGGRS
jgi:chromosomal replication initiator protein